MFETDELRDCSGGADGEGGGGVVSVEPEPDPSLQCQSNAWLED